MSAYKSYGLKGWQAPTSNGVHHVQPAYITNLSTTAELDDDEQGDVAAPLPGADRSAAGQSEGPTAGSCKSGGGSSRTFAKDKRKLREKRRSTGVVAYDNEHQSTSAAEAASADISSFPLREKGEELERADDETSRNTSYNEVELHRESNHVTSSVAITTPSDLNDNISDDPKSHNSSTAACHSSHPTSQSSHSHAAAPDCSAPSTADGPVSSAVVAPTSPTVVGNSSLAAAGRTATASSLRESTCKSRPALPLKPALRLRSSSGHQSAHLLPAAAANAGSTRGADWETEKQAQLSRINQLEKLVEEERHAKTLLLDQLKSRDSRIQQLEEKVDTLNKDLDMADEDYEKLEEENRVLLRAMAQLTSQ